MKITFQSTKYTFKNFLYLFPLAIIPAFFLSFTVARKEFFLIFEAFKNMDLSGISFGNIFQTVSVFNFSSAQSILGGIIGFIAIVPCVGMIMAFTDKHMRIGRRTFNGLFGKLNDNLMSTFIFAVVLFVAYELWALIAAALFLLASLLPFTAACITIAGLYLCLHIGLLYVVAAVYLWLPCMQITGFHPFEALRYSNILCESIKTRLVFSQLFCLLLAEALITASVLCLPQTGIVSLVVATLLYALLLMIFCVRMQMVYLERTQTERADLKKYYTY